MQNLSSLQDYLAAHSEEIGTRILFSYPALFGTDESPSPLLSQMLRSPYPAQTLAIMGVSRRWQLARNANVVAECGAGKTLIALGSMLVHSAGRPFIGLVMAPPHLVQKWARETFLTLPHVRVFLIDDMRNGGNPREPHGINEVRLRRGDIVREGMHTSLTELRRLGRKGWRSLCPETGIFCIGREKAKLSYFWKHSYGRSRSGRYLGALTNPDTGSPIETDGVRLTPVDFDKKRLHEIVEQEKDGTTKYCPLWQADGNKIVRMAPAEYMGRYMPEWFDYAYQCACIRIRVANLRIGHEMTRSPIAPRHRNESHPPVCTCLSGRPFRSESDRSSCDGKMASSSNATGLEEVAIPDLLSCLSRRSARLSERCLCPALLEASLLNWRLSASSARPRTLLFCCSGWRGRSARRSPS
jgi:hypothetical protein